MLAQFLVLGFFPAIMAWAAASDLLTMTISNKLVLLLVGGFLLVAPLLGMAPGAMGFHLTAGLVVLAVSFAMFSLGWIGGGDAKLVAAIALWLGLDQLFMFLITASIYGGSLTLMLLTFRHYALPGFLLSQPWAHRLHTPKNGVPYGIALAAAALSLYPHGVLMKLATGAAF